MNYIRKVQNYSEQKKTRYSAALLARSSTSDHSSLSSAITEKWTYEPVQIDGACGLMTSVDSLMHFIKEPMLSYLEEWSHWEHDFAPMFGPILTSWTKKGTVMICFVLC